MNEPHSGGALSYEAALQALIRAMAHDVAAHESGDFASIGRDLDEIASSIPRDLGERSSRIGLVMYFWDDWIDARNHDWQYHDPITRSDWPKMGRSVIAALERDVPIDDPMFLDHYRPRRRWWWPFRSRRDDALER